MKSFFQKIPERMGALVVLCACIFLIVFAVLSAANIKMPDIETLIAKLAPEPSRADEVRNYVIFTEVAFKDKRVETGTQYKDSVAGEIETQWCHLTQTAKDSQAHNFLTIARAGSDGKAKPEGLTPRSLLDFGLTATSAQSLINTHCRFQKQ
jgi:hypothetical protein